MTTKTQRSPRSYSTLPSEGASGASMPTDITPQGSALQHRIASGFVFAYTEGKCRICKLPASERGEVEEMLTRWISYPTINRWLADRYELAEKEWTNLTGRCLQVHRENHMGLTETAKALAVNERSEAIGQELMEAGRVISPSTIISEMMRRGFQQLMDGYVNFENPGDLLKVVEAFQNLDREVGGSLDHQVLAAVFHRYFELTVGFVDPTRQDAFSSIISNDPVMAGLLAAGEKARLRQPDAIDVTSVEDDDDDVPSSEAWREAAVEDDSVEVVEDDQSRERRVDDDD